jgi:metal-responsive CopG/Arc/MetJ family transcriptional regulator
MKMERVMIQLPNGLKSKLDRLRQQGTSISGFIRSLVEREFNQPLAGKKGQ